MAPEVAIVPLCIVCLLAGLAAGAWYGEATKVKMLTNMLTHGSPNAPPKAHTIVPETAEVLLERDARVIEREYAKATISQGVGDLRALYVAEGAEVPSDKVLEDEVKDMLSRSGTPEAGVPLG